MSKSKKVSKESTKVETPVEEINVEQEGQSTENESTTDETVTEQDINDEKSEDIVEQIPVEEVQQPVDELDFFKPITDEEEKFKVLMLDYVSLASISSDKIKIKDLENKVLKLCEIIYYPHISNIKNVDKLYSYMEKFFTKYRNSLLNEQTAFQHSHVLNNKVKFERCITIYSLMIHLVDCKNSKSQYTMNIERSSKILIDKFSTFISWLTTRIEKLK